MKGLAVGIGLLIVAALTLLLWPRLAPGRIRAGDALPAPSRAAPGVTEAPQPERPLEAPRSREEQIREELSQKRLPFYRFLRQNYADLIDRFAVIEALDTLDLVVTRDDDETLNLLVRDVVAPTAREYGFRKIRFLVRNPEDSVEPFRLIAESTDDGSGQWNTFRK